MKTLETTRNGLAVLAALMACYIIYDYFRAVSLEPYRVISSSLTPMGKDRLILRGVFFKNPRGELGNVP